MLRDAIPGPSGPLSRLVSRHLFSLLPFNRLPAIISSPATEAYMTPRPDGQTFGGQRYLGLHFLPHFASVSPKFSF